MNYSDRPTRQGRIGVLLVLMGLLTFGLAASFTGESTAQGLPGTGSRMFSEPKFLPVDEAFSFYTSLPEPGIVVVHWDIAPGYYLYREKFGFAADIKAEGAESLSAELPVGVAHHDEFFGDVEVYYDRVEARISLAKSAQQQALVLVIDFQGCSEQGLCYPPQQREIELTL